jgi:hypothetical protein
LIKKLEKLADKMEAGGEKSGDEQDDQMATTTPTKKSKVAKIRGRKFDTRRM